MGRSESKLGGRSLRGGSRRVSGLMRRHFIAVDPDTNLLEVDQIMRFARVRQLPVARDGELFGVVSYRDVIQAWLLALEGREGPPSDWMRQVCVERVMTRPPRSVTPRSTLRHTARVLCQLETGCVPVVERSGGSRIVGLVTESDLLRAAFDEFARPWLRPS